jgi:hypothetical protein
MDASNDAPQALDAAYGGPPMDAGRDVEDASMDAKKD